MNEKTGKHSADKSKMLEEALNFFYAKGVRGIAEADLFTAMGVTPNEFFAHFDNREDVLTKAIEHTRKKQEEINSHISKTSANAVEEIMSVLKNAAEIMQKVNPEFIKDVTTYYPAIMESGAQYSRDYTLGLYAAIINRGIKEGLFRSDINIQIVTRVIVENGYVFLNYNTFPPDKYPPNEVLRSIYLYYFRGLCKPEGAKIVDDFFAKHSF